MKNMATKQFVVTVLLIFALQGIILSYVYFSFYTSSVEGIKNLGISNMKSQATVMEILIKSKNHKISKKSIPKGLKLWYNRYKNKHGIKKDKLCK